MPETVKCERPERAALTIVALTQEAFFDACLIEQLDERVRKAALAMHRLTHQRREHWRIGILGRVQYFSGSVTDSAGSGTKLDLSGAIPGILLDATYY